MTTASLCAMGVQERVDQWFSGAYATIAAALRIEWDALDTGGCWCGSVGCRQRGRSESTGSRGCCRLHADGYRTAGITPDGMWSAAGLVRGKSADMSLVSCVQSRTTRDDAYRERLTRLFSTRIAVAEIIEVWYDVAQRAQEEIERFERWLQQRQGTEIPSAELDDYRRRLGEIGVPADEVDDVLAEQSPVIAPDSASA